MKALILGTLVSLTSVNVLANTQVIDPREKDCTVDVFSSAEDGEHIVRLERLVGDEEEKEWLVTRYMPKAGQYAVHDATVFSKQDEVAEADLEEWDEEEGKVMNGLAKSGYSSIRFSIYSPDQVEASLAKFVVNSTKFEEGDDDGTKWYLANGDLLVEGPLSGMSAIGAQLGIVGEGCFKK